MCRIDGRAVDECMATSQRPMAYAFGVESMTSGRSFDNAVGEAVGGAVGGAVGVTVVRSQRRGRPAGFCGDAESTVLAVDGVAESTVLSVLVVGRCRLICGDASTGLAVDEMCRIGGLAVDECMPSQRRGRLAGRCGCEGGVGRVEESYESAMGCHRRLSQGSGRVV